MIGKMKISDYVAQDIKLSHILLELNRLIDNVYISRYRVDIYTIKIIIDNDKYGNKEFEYLKNTEGLNQLIDFINNIEEYT